MIRGAVVPTLAGNPCHTGHGSIRELIATSENHQSHTHRDRGSEQRVVWQWQSISRESWIQRDKAAGHSIFNPPRPIFALINSTQSKCQHGNFAPPPGSGALPWCLVLLVCVVPGARIRGSVVREEAMGGRRIYFFMLGAPICVQGGGGGCT